MINNIKKRERKGKRGQITIFIIIAILIVVTAIGYFFLKDRVKPSVFPKELLPVYEYFLSCVEDETEIGAGLMGSQAGYIEVPEFEAGSDYMPFSSHLDFLGMGVPYWYYVSGNGITKEQVPSEEKMKSQLEDYLEGRLKECNFESFEEQGFIVEKEELKVDVVIKDREIEVGVEMPLTVSFGDVSAQQTSFEVGVKSRLGKFYNIARKIYEKEEESLFLENYGVDILRLYAPVDGSEIGCSPKLWYVDDIREDLISALEANIPATKVKGSYYSLPYKENKYFVQDIGGDVGGENEYVNFLYLSSWPMKLEVWPSDDGILQAEPVGLQEGLGMLGFCYTPYHFVYDFAYPVLIQVYDNEEMFQFPIAVVIEKNKPREALDVEGLPDVASELCEHKLTKMNVYTYDTKLEPVPAGIKFKCFDTTCSIGSTELEGSDAVLTANFPQCVNGYIIASAEGYETKKSLVSTVNEDSVSIILDKKYKLGFEVQKGNNGLVKDYAIVTFSGDDKTTTVIYPEQEEVELTEGQYEVKVYVYSNSTINLEGSSTEKCVDVPKSGILGIFGATEDKCFTLQIPNQVVSSAVSGGGTQSYYITESELEESSKIIINAEDFGIPNKVEDLQINYNNLEVSNLDIWFE